MFILPSFFRNIIRRKTSADDLTRRPSLAVNDFTGQGRGYTEEKEAVFFMRPVIGLMFHCKIIKKRLFKSCFFFISVRSA